MEYFEGDIVKTRKLHPCGSDSWTVLRTGADVKLKCRGCGHVIMVPHSKFIKMIVEGKNEKG